MYEKVQTITKTQKVFDIEHLPANLQARVTSYAHEVGANEELEYLHGRMLVWMNFGDALDDDTPDDIVEQLATGAIGFDKYPYDGIAWDILGAQPASYAGYLQATRYLRAVLPAEVVQADELYFLV